MSQSTIALIVMALTLVMYLTPKIPLSVTTIFAMIAMAATGIISYQEAFAGFSNPATLLVAAMPIIGQACFSSGLAVWFGKLLYKFVGSNERLFIVMLVIIASLLAVVLNGALVIAMLVPMIDGIVSQSKGAITRKGCYFPLGLASTFGNNLTTISASSMITAVGLLSAAGCRKVGLFEPTAMNLPALISLILLYMFGGQKLQKKWFDFEEEPLISYEHSEEETQGSPFKMIISGLTLVGVVVALISGMNYGACSMIGAAILIFTGCIDEKAAFNSVCWSAVIVVAGAMGFSKGLEVSGAGELLANFLIQLCGPVGQSAFGLCMILLLVGTLLSNVMSDNASVAIIVPIAIAMGKQLGYDVIPMALAAASGVKLAVATPISVATMTMVQSAGYRFKDYLKMGGLANVIGLVVTAIAIKVIYF